MLVVGLTGGIASGKSIVSSLLSNTHHIPLIDADLLARQVIEPGTSGYHLVVSHFGADRILQPDGITLNRAVIGDIVFHDEDERRWLNRVVHPRVRREIVRSALRYWIMGNWCCVVDVPLLVEAGLWKWVGEIVIVYVNEKLQLSRLLSRPSVPPLTPHQAQARISSQMPLSTKISYATSIIDNSGTHADLASQVERQVARWRAQQGGQSGWWWRVCWLLPPFGLVAGGLCLLRRWWRSKKRARRRGRGEVERRGKSRGDGEGEGETIGLKELSGRRRGGSSSTAEDD